MVPVFDMHCDTISLIESCRIQSARAAHKLPDTGKLFFSVSDEELKNGISFRENTRMIDAKRLKQSNYICQCLAVYSSKKAAEAVGLTPWEYLLRLCDTFDSETAKNADLVRPVTSVAEMEACFRAGYAPVLKTIEDSMALEGDLDRLQEVYRRGVRVVGFTWNFENAVAFGHRYVTDPKTGEQYLEVDNENGLKPAGFAFTKAMEELGILMDISHLNDAGIRDVFATVKPSTPVIATHSNARGLCPHPRNLTDDFLRAIADHGGLTGINFCHAFLNPVCIRGAQKFSHISDMVEHIKYIKNVAGIDVIGLGSDFDGITSEVEFYGCGEIHALADGMEKAGFTDDEIEKVFYRNAMRVFREVIG